jgi:4-aminobutyrate aminotransferase-like enzyme
MNAFDPARDRDDSADDLLARRLDNVGAATVLFYRRPLEMRRGAGCWMQAADGDWYLDFYNNVPSVGHGHPRVVASIQEQLAELNINSRYLHPLTETYLERLKATLPESLANVVMTCSGSEANDLALRIARNVTGGSGVVVTATAYHGNTAAVTEISPASFKRGRAPPLHVVTVPPPSRTHFGDDIRAGFAAAVAEAVGTLRARGHAPAALICDSVFSSDGVFAEPAGFLGAAVETIRREGGIFVADEVQPGFARTGDAFWGFGRHGLAPDIVTMGKPMGNGFPVAGLATHPDRLRTFCEDVGYFNTFAGTPVAAAAGLAVLDVIQDEGLQENARRTGSYLRERLETVAAADPRIGDIRGAGLFVGLDLCDGDGAPDGPFAADIINGLGEKRILVGAAGPYGHTLKLRPPLSIVPGEVDIFVDALAEMLREQ